MAKVTKKAVKKVTKKATSKAVAVVEEAALVEGNLSSHALAQVADFDTTAFEGVELDVADNLEIFKNDIVIPKLWLIQAMSEFRKQKKADEGDYVDSRSEEIVLPVASEIGYLPLIVMKTFKRWQTFKLVSEGTTIKKEFVSSEIVSTLR